MWQGQPIRDQSNFFYESFLYIVGLISLTAFLIWSFIVFIHNAPTILKVFGILFILGAIFQLSANTFLHRIRKSRIYYAVTNERIFVEYWFLRKRVKSYRIKLLPKPVLKLYSNGVGSILIYYEKPWSSRLLTYGMEYSWRDQFRRLEHIPNAEYVFDLISEKRK